MQRFENLFYFVVAINIGKNIVISFLKTRLTIEPKVSQVLKISDNIFIFLFSVYYASNLYDNYNRLAQNNLNDFYITLFFEAISILFLTTLSSNISQYLIFFINASKHFLASIFLITNENISKTNEISEEEHDKKNILETSLHDHINTNYLNIDDIDNNFVKDMAKIQVNRYKNIPDKFHLVYNHFIDIDTRNDLEIERLINFSRQNLLLGTLISIAAIVFLIYDYRASEVVRNSFSNNINIFSYFEYYFPKLSIIVLIEVIAFFFLRLYKNSISDIKNRQDKRTEIEMQIILLKLSILSNNDDNIKEITNTLLNSNKVVKDDKKEPNTDVDNQKQYTEIIKELISKIKI
ncbi:hypothetical protein GCM10011514_39760 [Emticicia aquatilis]|uniref:Uncharacterized protein n=1 Tax=Emticicia aquatilis TaxID=1537369 RepID=A0A916Z1A1_9BACT|nr:hypothetical protein [Emticicia aquatilis]GGD71695.1 hypothetical protein GCM10011514_39760 [Emticicia aquatilis]